MRDGELTSAFGVGSVDSTPRAFPDLAGELEGQRIDTALAEAIAREALGQTSPGSDLHADAEYRRHLGTVMLKRVLLKAARSSATAAAH